MTKVGLGIAAVLAFLSTACSDDPIQKATGAAAGSGAASGSGGEAGAGGSAGAPSCDGTESPDEKFAQALELLRAALADRHVPGGAVAVIQEGKLVNLGVVGSKRADECDPVTPDTLFRTGFPTELITTLAALDAVEDGSLSLEESIKEKGLPTLAVSPSNGNAEDVTLHHLLTYSSMYRSDSDDPTDSTTCANLADAYANAKDPVLQAKPGSMQDRDDRSNMELAGLALENVDGKPFAEVAAARVLGPLAMGGGYDTATILASDHSLGHGPDDFDPEHPTPIEEVDIHADCRNRDPSEQYHGSIRDLAKLLEHLTGGAEGKVIDPPRLDAMLSNQGPNFWSDSYAAYGTDGYFSSDLDDDVFWTGSYSWGFTEQVDIFKERRLAVVTLMNASYGWPGVVTHKVAEIYGAKPFSEAPQPPTPDAMKSLAGTYKDDLGFERIESRTLVVSWDDAQGKLVADLDGTDIALTGVVCADNFDVTLPIAPDEPALQARFWRDESGEAYAISLRGDNGPPFFRVPNGL